MKHLLLGWTEKARLERDKAQMQAENARLDRDKEKLRFDPAKFWGMLMGECGQELTAHGGYNATKPSAPLLMMLAEMAFFLQRNKPLGKAEQEQFMQKLFRETDATFLDVLHSWNRVAVKQKKIRSLITPESPLGHTHRSSRSSGQWPGRSQF